MKTNVYSSFVLPNGLRCVCCNIDTAAEYCGLVVDTGSRDETSEQEGLAHFVEHTIFKGTDRRRSWHIINRMESVGGELNAYTTKEATAVYSIFPGGNLNRALELIADLVCGSRFPQAEIDKERDVVDDEINSYLDMPSEAVFDDFDDLIFAGSSLGHNILGRLDTLRGFSSEVCREYLSSRYTPGRMVLFYLGRESVGRFERYAMRYFGHMHHADRLTERRVPVTVEPFSQRRDVGSHQAHTVVGGRIGSMYSEDRFATALLTNIIGGPGMNSMLNVEMRERRGLVYSVEASPTLYTDCGLLSIYYGCDPEDVDRCRRIIDSTLTRLATDKLTPRRLEAAKRQYIGQLSVAADSRESIALGMARAMLYHNELPNRELTNRRISDVTAEELRDAAQRLAPIGLSQLTLG